jgi:hypothetical protein
VGGGRAGGGGGEGLLGVRGPPAGLREGWGVGLGRGSGELVADGEAQPRGVREQGPAGDHRPPGGGGRGAGPRARAVINQVDYEGSGLPLPVEAIHGGVGLRCGLRSLVFDHNFPSTTVGQHVFFFLRQKGRRERTRCRNKQ